MNRDCLRMPFSPRIQTLVCAIIVVLSLTPAAELFADESVDYETQIKPLLARKCYSCHGVLKQEAGLRLETRSLMLEGGDSDEAIVPGNADDSLIIERISDTDEFRMPPAEDGAALKSEEIALLRSWIDQGAQAPDEEIPLAPTEHWAFRPVSKPPLPGLTLEDGEAPLNPIDILLEARRREHNLKVQPFAERTVLIRRLYLDLIGLPPNREQLNDQRPWEEIVDELLQSPHYGERWGRHWMDVWRYSDWYGLGAQLRNSQKHMWHWRDWIITSLNDDKGYDRMIQEMLAGDEIAPTDPDVIAGTGFLARNYYLFNRTTWLDSTIEHTGKAFLGLTLNCAKCHDHKYDPISQVDYYSLRAIFEPHQVRLDPIPGVTDFEQDGLPRVFDNHPDIDTWLHVRGDPKNPDKETEITPRVPEIFSGFQPDIEPVSLPSFAFAPGTRDYVQQDQLRIAEERIKTAEQQLAVARKALADAPKKVPTETAQEVESLQFEDDFSQPDPENWEIVGSDWEYKNGALYRTTSTREREPARFKHPLPRDFDVTCRYTTTGGALYKSVTFRFDESADGQYDNYVYTSAHEPGPKVQVAYSRGGVNSYPADGRVARPIKVGEAYEIRFAIRDRLVNVWLNGEFILAYRYPDRRPGGHLTLAPFDATVAFDWIKVRNLPKDVELVDATNSIAAPADDPEAKVKIAEAKLKSATSLLNARRAIFEADRARFDQPNDEFSVLANKAVRLEAVANLAAAEAELLEAGADAQKAEAAKKKMQRAEKTLASADEGGTSYSDVRASRKALETPEHKEPDYPAVYPSQSTGRRLAFAKWVTSPENPLTARVAVNHVWTRHFGEPLVDSVFDFGLRAPRPVHADVLDYLAADLMESGWSLRHLHRQIVTSQAYRLSSSSRDADPQSIKLDPDNRFYWRMNARRMEAQVVRDSVLSLAAKLDLTMGGPSLDVGNASQRRSVYFKHSRDDQDKFLSMFDDADLLQCYRRSESIVPQQALALANSQLSLSMAPNIAKQIGEGMTNPNEQAFIREAFTLLLGRDATDAEAEVCLDYCKQLRELVSANQQLSAADLESRVRTRLVHSLLNHNDFITIR